MLLKAIVGQSFRPESIAFFNRLATKPSYRRAQLYDRMIRTLVASDVWFKLDGLYLRSAANSATALTNLRSSSYTSTVVGTPTFAADSGYSGGSSANYLDSGFNPSSSPSPLFVQDSATIFSWTISYTPVGTTIGCGTGATRNYLDPKDADNKTYWRVNTGSDSSSAANAATDGLGLFVATRTASNATAVYRNQLQLATAAAVSAAVPNSTVKSLWDDIAGDPGAGGIVAADGFGAQMSQNDVNNLYLALHTYLQAVAGVA